MIHVYVSCLSGKASTMLVEFQGLSSNSICVLKTKPDKFDIERREHGILFYQFTHCFTIQNNDYDVIIEFLDDSTSVTSCKSASLS